MLAEYAELLPLTVRQIFYRLIAGGAIEKSDRSYRRLADHMTSARRAGMVGFDAIRDDGITHANGHRIDGYTSPDCYLDHVGRQLAAWANHNDYSRDPHEGQPHAIEVWCEAAGMVPQLAGVVAEFAIDVYSAGGFTSLTAIKGAADRASVRDVPTLLLHVGDLDRHGLRIYSAWAQDVTTFAQTDGATVETVRVALTPEQVAQHRLPEFYVVRDGRRELAVQCEALPPDVLAGYVRDAVLDFYDEDIAAAVQQREEEEREQVDGMLAELREQIGFAG